MLGVIGSGPIVRAMSPTEALGMAGSGTTAVVHVAPESTDVATAARTIGNPVSGSVE